jgi:cytochrome b561
MSYPHVQTLPGTTEITLRIVALRPAAQTRPVRRHHWLTRSLHWLTAALLVAAAASIYARSFTGHRGAGALLLAVHESCGIIVLLLTLARLAWRARARVGILRAQAPRAMRLLAGAVHFALYAMLVALPLLGWLAVSARGRVPQFLGLLRLPQLIARDRDVFDDLLQWHGLAAWLLLSLVVVHVAAALLHHYVLRDDVLYSMQPFARRSRPHVVTRLRPLLLRHRRARAAAPPAAMRTGGRR